MPIDRNTYCLRQSYPHGKECAYKKKHLTIVSMYGKDWEKDYILAKQFHPIYPVAYKCNRYKDVQTITSK